MKFINKLLLVSLVVLISGCGLTELDLLDNPNEVTPENASVNDLYNNIQLTFGNIFVNLEGAPGGAARMYHAGGNFTYEAWTGPGTFGGLWFNVYSALFPDIKALVEINELKGGFDIHVASANILKAYTLMGLVDVMGNVPYSEAGEGTDIISPKADDGAAVYAAAIGLLDDATTLLRSTTSGAPAVDQFYGGDADKWITLANTLKLRAAVTTRLVDGGAASTINALVSDVIDDANEDFQGNLGSNRTNPDSRHWMYQSHYETGDGAYLSNYYMWLLRADKMDADENPVVDPRIRYYFYRKVDDAAGQDPTTYSCHFSTLPDQDQTPAHYKAVDPRLPYCIASADGYSGRDHLNGEGIPPDGPIRTSFGLYPGGGQFDWSNYADSRKSGTTGGQGAGIFPIMLSSFVDFMRAEAALTLGTNDDAKTMLESGIRKSMDKVIGFESLVSATMSTAVTLKDGSEGTIKELFGTTQDDIDDYVAFVLDSYDVADADGKLDIVMKEYYIALWGNGIEAYNMYRRTGKPNNMAPSLEPDPGAFARSFFLPDVHVNRNANATQKTITDKVFWDDGSIDLY